MLQNQWKLETIKFLFKNFVSIYTEFKFFHLHTAQDYKHRDGLKLDKLADLFNFECDIFQKCPNFKMESFW